jgi:RecB family exonuclease
VGSAARMRQILMEGGMRHGKTALAHDLESHPKLCRAHGEVKSSACSSVRVMSSDS